LVEELEIQLEPDLEGRLKDLADFSKCPEKILSLT